MDREPRPSDYAPTVSWDDYLKIEDPPGFRLEYEEGRLIVSPTGRAAHDALRDLLLYLLLGYEERYPDRCFVISEHSFFMPPGARDYRPDIAVTVDERKDGPIDPAGWGEGAPDIAIEVLSPSTIERDLGLKARRYFEQGSDEYWVFEPIERWARFLRPGPRGWSEVPLGAGGAYSTPLLPGFELEVGPLWRRLDQRLRLGR